MSIIRDDEPVVIFCNEAMKATLVEYEPKVSDAVVVTDIVDPGDAVVVPVKEFREWLYSREEKKISIDDNHIAQMVEQKAAKAMQDEDLKVCKSQIGCERGYFVDSQPGPMLKKALEDFMKDNREEIIDKAADKLAERLSRTKVVKEAAAKRVSEEKNAEAESGKTKL